MQLLQYRGKHPTKLEDNVIKIEFNNETREGRVSDFAKYEDKAWHCWNKDFVDTVCE